jgi:hypothetical protein
MGIDETVESPLGNLEQRHSLRPIRKQNQLDLLMPMLMLMLGQAMILIYCTQACMCVGSFVQLRLAN